MSKQSEELYEIIGDSREKYIEHADNNDNKGEDTNMTSNNDCNESENTIDNVITFENKKNKHTVLKICITIAAVLFLVLVLENFSKGKDSYVYKTFFQNKNEEKNDNNKQDDKDKTEADVFDKYVENTLSNEIGMAPIDDVDKATVDFTKSVNSVSTTLDGLKGIVSYQKADLDSDGKEELMVFTIDKQDKEIMVGQWDRVCAGVNGIQCSIYENNNGEVTLACKQPIFEIGNYNDDLVNKNEYVKIELLKEKYIVCSFSLEGSLFSDPYISNGVVFDYDGNKLNLFYECLNCTSDGMVPKEDNDVPTSENLIKLGVNQKDIFGYKSLGGKLLFTYLFDNSDNFDIVNNEIETVGYEKFQYSEDRFKPVVLKIGTDEIDLENR